MTANASRRAIAISPASVTRSGQLGHRAHDVELFVDLVEQAHVLGDAVLLDLARQQKHRRGAGPGRRQAGPGVVHARARHDERHARAAGARA